MRLRYWLLRFFVSLFVAGLALFVLGWFVVENPESGPKWGDMLVYISIIIMGLSSFAIVWSLSDSAKDLFGE